MKKIAAIIEKSDEGGFGIYVPNIPGLIGYGQSEAEAKAELAAAIESLIEHYEESGMPLPAEIQGGLLIEYRYDFTAFFRAFPFINASEFARQVGINPSMMRKYKEGIAFASEKQKQRVQQAFDDIVQRLNVVHF